MIKAILFDFDYVVGIKPDSTEDQEKWYEEYIPAEVLRKEKLIAMKESFEELGYSRYKIRKCLKARTELRVPNKFAFDLIEKASLYGIKSYIGTNAPPVAMRYWFKAHKNLKKHFSGVFCPEDFGQIRKPKPEFFVSALKEMKLWPHEVAFYDDKLENVAGAVKAGLRSFHYKGGKFRTSKF